MRPTRLPRWSPLVCSSPTQVMVLFAATFQLHRDLVFHPAYGRHHRQGHRRSGRGGYPCDVSPSRLPSPGTSSPGTTASPAAARTLIRRHRRLPSLPKSGAWRAGGQRHLERRWRSFISPLLGFLPVRLMMVVAVMDVSGRMRPNKVDKLFRRLQLVSAAPTAWASGGNDAQIQPWHHRLLLIATGCSTTADTRRPPGSSSGCYAAIGWAPCSAAGASSRPWGKIASSNPWAAFVLRTGGR